jgi:hypothetical protein
MRDTAVPEELEKLKSKKKKKSTYLSTITGFLDFVHCRVF